MVLNAADHLAVGVGRYEHITPALRDVLHWLSVPQRIQFKIAISAFDCVREHWPAYFNNVCIPVASISGLANRSAEHHDMLVQEHSSANRVSTLQPPPSGTRFHHSSTNHPLVVDSLELGWKPSLELGWKPVFHTGLRIPLRTFVEEHIILRYIYIIFSTAFYRCSNILVLQCCYHHQSELVGDVAVPVSVRQAVLFWALRSPDARPRLNWRRSSSTVLSIMLLCIAIYLCSSLQ